MGVGSIGRALVFGTVHRNPKDLTSAVMDAATGLTTALNVYHKDPEPGETAYREKGPKPAEPKLDKPKAGPNTMDTDPSNPLR